MKTRAMTLAVLFAITASMAAQTSKATVAARKTRIAPAWVSTTATCGMTSIHLNSEEPSCNSHNARWISVSETSNGNAAYWSPTPLAHPTFDYHDGFVGLPDGGTYLITTEIPVASDCGIIVTAKLKINDTVVGRGVQISTGGNRILRHRFVYVKNDPESSTDVVSVTIESVGGYGYAQGIVLDIQRTDIH